MVAPAIGSRPSETFRKQRAHQDHPVRRRPTASPGSWATFDHSVPTVLYQIRESPAVQVVRTVLPHPAASEVQPLLAHPEVAPVAWHECGRHLWTCGNCDGQDAQALASGNAARKWLPCLLHILVVAPLHSWTSLQTRRSWHCGVVQDRLRSERGQGARVALQIGQSAGHWMLPSIHADGWMCSGT